MRDSLSAEELCRRLRPVMGNKIDRLYLKYALSENNEERLEMEHAFKLLYEKHLATNLLADKVLLAPPSGEIVDGEYKLGIVTYADKDFFPFGLKDEEWIRHMCITGMSGSGKTNFAFLIAKNLIQKNKQFWIFDWKKSFRPLLLQDEEVMCFTIGNPKIANLFRININRPPKGVDPKEWLGILSDLITESFFASYGVHKLLTEVLDEAFNDFGVYKGSQNYPTWYQIKDRLMEKQDNPANKRGRESEWLESAIRIAHVLTFGHFGTAINNKGEFEMSIEEMLNKRIIFELHNLNTPEKKFFCEFLLAYIYKLKKTNQTGIDETFRHAILVDEAHNIFLKDKTNFMKESVTDMIYREVREYGISMICLDQHISKISDTVVGNSATHVAFQQILPADVLTISSVMQIKEFGKFFSMIPVGAAIVRLSARHFQPFTIRIPFVSIKKDAVTDETIRARMQNTIREGKRLRLFNDAVQVTNLRRRIDELRNKVHASGTATFGDYDNLPYDDRLKQEVADARKLEVIKSYFKFNREALQFLELLKEKSMFTSELYEKMDISTRKCNELNNDLAFMGLIHVQEERTPSGLKKVLSITEKGNITLEVLKKTDFSTVEAIVQSRDRRDYRKNMA